MVARYYSSSLGRFMAVDPGDDTALEDPQSWNKYAYVRNNPLGHTDPKGTCIEDLCIAETAAVVAVGAMATQAVQSYLNSPDPNNPSQTQGQALVNATLQAIGDAFSNLLTNKNSDSAGKDKPVEGGKSSDSSGEGEKAKDRRAREQSADRAARRGADTWEEPASEKYAKEKAKEKEKEGGKKARRQHHDEKKGPDRTKSELDESHKRPH